MVYWLGLSVQVRVRARDRKCAFIPPFFFFSVLKSDKHFVLPSWPSGPSPAIREFTCGNVM